MDETYGTYIDDECFDIHDDDDAADDDTDHNTDEGTDDDTDDDTNVNTDNNTADGGYPVLARMGILEEIRT